MTIELILQILCLMSIILIVVFSRYSKRKRKMKPAETLVELLKAPFNRGVGDCYYRIYSADTTITTPLVTVNFGNFRNIKNGVRLFVEFCEFIKDAMNEKWERDSGEPLHWDISEINGECGCPVCKHVWYPTEYDTKDDEWKYCPYCGQRLLPP